MSATGKLRGRLTRWDNEGEEFRFVDTNESTVKTHKDRTCGYCNLPNREDEHDACIANLPGVMNACCGHGDADSAYIMYDSKKIVRGGEALLKMHLARVQVDDA